MISKHSIETAYSFLHQKQNIYIHSSLAWQREDIEYAVGEYAGQMDSALYEQLARGREDFLYSHASFSSDIASAVSQLEAML